MPNFRLVLITLHDIKEAGEQARATLTCHQIYHISSTNPLKESRSGFLNVSTLDSHQFVYYLWLTVPGTHPSFKCLRLFLCHQILMYNCVLIAVRNILIVEEYVSLRPGGCRKMRLLLALYLCSLLRDRAGYPDDTLQPGTRESLANGLANGLYPYIDGGIFYPVVRMSHHIAILYTGGPFRVSEPPRTSSYKWSKTSMEEITHLWVLT